MRIPTDAIIVLCVVLGVVLTASIILFGCSLRKAAKMVGLRFNPVPGIFERKWAVRISLAILLTYLLALLYAFLIEPDWVELTKTEIPVRQAVLGQERFRIVHLSDLHLKEFGRRERRVVELVQGAKPDLIVITGDYGHTPKGIEVLLELGRFLEAPYGKYGVRGNDDYQSPTRQILESAGIKLLENETKLIERYGRRLCLVGQPCESKVSLKAILREQQEDDYTIFLHHMPAGLDELGRLDPSEHVDLFLCGHTHGGQVCVPFWGAVVTESKYHKKYERGLYCVNNVRMYVNRGLGVSVLPIRFLARPEVAVIDLVVRR